MVDLFEQYETAIKEGCGHNCSMCDLFLLSRDECIIEANKKWETWTKLQHDEFQRVLEETK